VNPAASQASATRWRHDTADGRTPGVALYVRNEHDFTGKADSAVGKIAQTIAPACGTLALSSSRACSRGERGIGAVAADRAFQRSIATMLPVPSESTEMRVAQQPRAVANPRCSRCRRASPSIAADLRASRVARNFRVGGQDTQQRRRILAPASARSSASASEEAHRQACSVAA